MVRALDTLEEYKGRLSFNDCLLVIVSQDGGIEWVVSFDKDFDQVSGLRRVGTCLSLQCEIVRI